MHKFLKKRFQLTSNRGFTLLELLVVVSIVAFLATISLVALGVAQAKARDSKRQVDAFSIIKAAELHRNDMGFYPAYYEGLGMNIDTSLVEREGFFQKFAPKTAYAGFKVEQFDGGGGGGGPCPQFSVCTGYLNCDQNYTSCSGAPGLGICAVNEDCLEGASHEQMYLNDECGAGTGSSCWLNGLDPYLSLIPVDPGKHQNAWHDNYYISTHPNIVKNHGLCFFWSYENAENTIDGQTPYSDISLSESPILFDDGSYDPNWSVLCVQ